MNSTHLTDLVDYLKESPTPYHAVASTAARLIASGFRQIAERDDWGKLSPGGYFVVQNESAIVAFVIPHSYDIFGFRIVGAHTDSPNLRLKPKSEYSKEGYLQFGVEVYGGVLLNSWLDRDLSVAGRVLIRTATGDVKSRLVRIDRPLARIPQLAIHLDRDVNEKGLVLNRQEHLAPIWALSGQAEGEILSLCAHALGISRAQIVGTDLMLFDTLQPTIAGFGGEFLFSARLDNLAMCHASTQALIDAKADVEQSNFISLSVLFDHEEVGSHSSAGASSGFLPRILERITLALEKSRSDYHRILSGSLCLSADMAHAVHPNYPEKHEPRHKPVVNGGPVIKYNAQQRYATCAKTAALFKAICKSIEVPVQEFVTRTDMPCGSTIGPLTSTLLGIPTIDVGNAMLSMHSIREMAGSRDPEWMGRAIRKFFLAPSLD